MDIKTGMLLIIIILLISLCLYIAQKYFHMRKLWEGVKEFLHSEQERAEHWLSRSCELEKEIQTYKDMERVIKVERVTIQPKEIECKFMLHERFVDDTELFKRVITSEVARYMAEELEKDPYLCKVYHERNIIQCQEYIKIRFRMLPYAEGVVWDDILEEEK